MNIVHHNGIETPYNLRQYLKWRRNGYNRCRRNFLTKCLIHFFIIVIANIYTVRGSPDPSHREIFVHEKERSEWNGKNHLANIQRIPLVTEIQVGLNNRSTIDEFGVISPRMEVKRAKHTSMLPMEFLPSLSGQTFVRKKVLNDQDDYFQHEHLNNFQKISKLPPRVSPDEENNTPKIGQENKKRLPVAIPIPLPDSIPKESARRLLMHSAPLLKLHTDTNKENKKEQHQKQQDSNSQRNEQQAATDGQPLTSNSAQINNKNNRPHFEKSASDLLHLLKRLNEIRRQYQGQQHVRHLATPTIKSENNQTRRPSDRRARIFSGPLLAAENIAQKNYNREQQQSKDNSEPTAEYHYRRPQAPGEKHFRLTSNKMLFRPRIRIRKPPGYTSKEVKPTQQQFGAATHFGQNINATNGIKGYIDKEIHAPIKLPQLATFNNDEDGPQQQIKHIRLPPYQSAQLPRQRFIAEEVHLPPPSDSSMGNSLGSLPVSSSLSENAPNKIESIKPFTTTETTTTTTSMPPTMSQQKVLTSTNPISEFGSIGEEPPKHSLPFNTPPPSAPSSSSSSTTTTVIETTTISMESENSIDSALGFGATGDVGPLPPGFHEAFGLMSGNGETVLGSNNASVVSQEPAVVITTTTMPTTTTMTTQPPTTSTTTLLTTSSQLVENPFFIPENSGLRPVSPPKEFSNTGGFGSVHNRGPSFESFGSESGLTKGQEPPPPNVQIEPPLEGVNGLFTGDSGITSNKKGPDSDGYGPPIAAGAVAPPIAPSISVGGAAAGHPLPVPDEVKSGPRGQSLEPVENKASTMKPSALLNFIRKADEGFNQVITHFEQGTPIEAAAIDIMEVALGSQKLDSQAKLLSHVDRAVGLDNLQRLQRWANTGGALDMIKDQFAKIAKNYKPPPEIRGLTVPPAFDYLLQPPRG